MLGCKKGARVSDNAFFSHGRYITIVHRNVGSLVRSSRSLITGTGDPDNHRHPQAFHGPDPIAQNPRTRKIMTEGEWVVLNCWMPIQLR